MKVIAVTVYGDQYMIVIIKQEIGVHGIKRI
jgi:hypothetical protein